MHTFLEDVNDPFPSVSISPSNQTRRHMFNVISWESFLFTAAAVIGTYYAITALAFYRKELGEWIKKFGRTPVSIEAETVEDEYHENMMGNAQALQAEQLVRSSSASPEELLTSGSNEEPEAIQMAEPKNDLLIGTVADLLEEVKALIQLIAEYGTGKTESEALFNALFIRYPHLQQTSYPLAISFYICDAAKGKFAYELTSTEVMTWWVTPTIPSN